MAAARFAAEWIDEYAQSGCEGKNCEHAAGHNRQKSSQK
jgi:hypothetical protein